MTGNEHFREAESLLEVAHRLASPGNGLSDEDATRLVGLALQRAQVFATLAVAAALDPQVTDEGTAHRIAGEMTQS